jgi:hypothetical protein
MGATKIMVIRHAEKPGTYSGTAYSGVDEFGTVSGAAGTKHLVTLGWERAGALIALFASPYGPRTPLATPKFLFASNPDAKLGDDTSDEGPSERPYETLTALKAKLNLNIDATHRKSHFAEMVTTSWPVGPAGKRYDLVFVFDRPTGRGPITGFTLVPQQLLAGDLPNI